MIHILLILSTLFASLAAPASGYTQEEFDPAVADAVVSLMKELKYSDNLDGKKIAVYGFSDLKNGTGCNPLSSFIANKITAEIHKIRNFSPLRFTIVSRHNLEAVEMEYLLKRGGGALYDERYSGFQSLLEGSDILITGTWQNGDGQFVLNIKAIEIKEKRTRELTAVSKTIDKMGLSTDLLRCLSPDVSGTDTRAPASADVSAMQEKIASYNRQIDEIQKRMLTEQTKSRLKKTIEEQKKTIQDLHRRSAGLAALGHTAQRADKELAFVSIETEPPLLDVYIDGYWVGKSPVEMVEVESGLDHAIEARADSRYFLPVTLLRRYDPFSRITERIVVPPGRGQVLLMGKETLDRVDLDGEPLKKFNSQRPIVEIPAGKRSLRLWSGNRSKVLDVDLWAGDLLRINYGILTQTERKAALLNAHDEFVVDQVSGLMWQKGESGERLSWKNALNYCRGLSLGGYSDWRLPRKDELEGIVAEKPFKSPRSATARLYVPPDIFPSALQLKHPNFWSGTEKGSSYAYYLSAASGKIQVNAKTENYYVKAVRDGR